MKQEDQQKLTTTMDDLRTFRFEGLSPGLVDLQIEAKDGTEIVIPTFESTD